MVAFDGAGLWSFGNGFAKNVVIFGVDDDPSSHTDNLNPNLGGLFRGLSWGGEGGVKLLSLSKTC